MKESIEAMFSLKGKVAIVTGGNGGIGKGIARGLAGAGANIVIAARNRVKTDEAVAEMKRDFGVEAIGMITHMRKPAEVEKMVKDTPDKLGLPDDRA